MVCTLPVLCFSFVFVFVIMCVFVFALHSYFHWCVVSYISSLPVFEAVRHQCATRPLYILYLCFYFCAFVFPFVCMCALAFVFLYLCLCVCLYFCLFVFLCVCLCLNLYLSYLTACSLNQWTLLQSFFCEWARGCALLKSETLMISFANL